MTREAYPKWDYKEYPKTLPPDDLWGQVRRTIMGKPIPPGQIEMMMEAIRRGLDLQANDCLLDLGCGNGALSSPLFDRCASFVGVDASEYLIEVAQRNFSSAGRDFICSDVNDYLRRETLPPFDKILCFGTFSYLSNEEAFEMLALLRTRCTSVRRFFLGNLPDRARAAAFYSDADLPEADLDTHRSQIGLWRDQAFVMSMAEKTGWQARIEQMPDDFYQAHYRYNVVLEPAA